MERSRYFQLELFSSNQDPKVKKPNLCLSNSFWVYISKYEKTILVIIGFIITAIFSFCLGVERGKIITSPKLEHKFDLADKSKLSLSDIETGKKLAQTVGVKSKDNIPDREEVKSKLEEPQIIAQPIKKEDRYTVQVATYRTRISAQRETERLKKKGFSALILCKGNYVVICVGDFSDKKKAEPLLLQLRQNYQDCYIRRL